MDQRDGLLTRLPEKTVKTVAAHSEYQDYHPNQNVRGYFSSPRVLTFRIDFNALLLAGQSRHGLGAEYITDMLPEYKPNRPLRTLPSGQIEIPRVH